MTQAQSNEQEVSQSAEQKGRRRLLHAITGGSALLAGATLPKKWGQPVIDSVTLPAHAAATGPQITSCLARGPQGTATDGGGTFRICDAGMGNPEFTSFQACVSPPTAGIPLQLEATFESMGSTVMELVGNAVTEANGCAHWNLPYDAMMGDLTFTFSAIVNGVGTCELDIFVYSAMSCPF